MNRLALSAILALALCALISAPGALGAPPKGSEPPLTIPRTELEAAFHCDGDVEGSKVEPLLYVAGTGSTGEQGLLLLRPAFEAFGHPVCYVDFPDYTTADIQISVQYLVYAIRQESQMAGRPIAILGISQGALLPRFALTYWAGLRSKVSDVIAAAGTQHGTTLAGGCSETSPCPPAVWQQAAGSNLLKALNRQPIEAPGPTSWTTVRSTTDEVVQPQLGPHPTSALAGAANIVIQAVCPGRATTHVGTVVDSVTFAALYDAVGHKGPAKVSRFPSEVCLHPYGPGLEEERTANVLAAGAGLIGGQGSSVPTVPAEPKVRAYVKRPMTP